MVRDGFEWAAKRRHRGVVPVGFPSCPESSAVEASRCLSRERLHLDSRIDPKSLLSYEIPLL